MPDALHDCRAAVGGDVLDQRLAFTALPGADAQLDEFMLFQRAIDLGDQRRTDPLASDLQHGFQTMCLSAQKTALGGGQDGAHGENNGRQKERTGYHGACPYR